MALSKEELSAIIDGIAKADDKDKAKTSKSPETKDCS